MDTEQTNTLIITILSVFLTWIGSLVIMNLQLRRSNRSKWKDDMLDHMSDFISYANVITPNSSTETIHAFSKAGITVMMLLKTKTNKRHKRFAEAINSFQIYILDMNKRIDIEAHQQQCQILIDEYHRLIRR